MSTMPRVTADDARHAGMSELIDDAGLFPPAELSMADALAAHAELRAGPHAWLVCRFLCPSGRLDELLQTGPVAPRVGVVLPPGEEPARSAEALPSRDELPQLHVEVIEVRTAAMPTADDLVELARAVRARQPAAQVFVEPPDSTRLEAVRDTVDACRRGSAAAAQPIGLKLRCGGPRAELVPDPDVVTEALTAVAAAGVAAKATAGLHHPVRHRDAWHGGWAHGFLNLLAGASLAVSGAAAEQVRAAVAESDPAAFAFDAAGLRWRNASFDADALGRARAGPLTAFGSCSVDEPVEDLIDLGILAGEPRPEDA